MLTAVLTAVLLVAGLLFASGCASAEGSAMLGFAAPQGLRTNAGRRGEHATGVASGQPSAVALAWFTPLP
jgi:hypothetical protein